MSPTGITKLIVRAEALVLGVGIVDAAAGGEWDLLVLMSIGFTLSIVLLTRLESRRPAVPLRRDLVVWLENRAAVSGEPLTAVADRAIASYVDQYGRAPVHES